MSADDHLTANPNAFAPPPVPPDAIQADALAPPPVLEVVGDEPPRRLRRVRPPHPGFWWALLWGLGFHIVQLMITLAAVVGVLLVRLLMSGDPQAYLQGLQQPPPGRKYSEELSLLLMAAFVGVFLSFFIYPLAAVRLVVGRDWPRRVALRLPSATHVILALFSLPGLVLIASGVAAWAHAACKEYGIPHMGNQEDLREMARDWPVWFSLLAIALGPGIGEEILCRGFFGRGIVARHGPVLGMLLTSLVFGLMHLDPPVVAGTFLIGLWLHYVYLNSRSLLLPMLLHFLNNSLAVLVVALEIQDPTEGPGGTSPWLYGGAGVLLGCVALALWLTRARLDTPDGGPGWQPSFPGVEAPPPGSGTVVVRPWPGWLAVFVALLGVAAFAGCFYLAQPAG